MNQNEIDAKVARNRASGRRVGWIVAGSFALLLLGGCTWAVIGGIMYAASPEGQAASRAAAASPADTPVADQTNTPDTPGPQPTSYAQGRAAEKHDFMAAVNESISGAMIAGNKFKYVGKNVDLHCTVVDIPQADFFNASCPDDTIVIEADAKTLSPGQAIRILGTVVQPMEGNNAMGGNATFPTVKAEFME